MNGEGVAVESFLVLPEKGGLPSILGWSGLRFRVRGLRQMASL